MADSANEAEPEPLLASHEPEEIRHSTLCLAASDAKTPVSDTLSKATALTSPPASPTQVPDAYRNGEFDVQESGKHIAAIHEI